MKTPFRFLLTALHFSLLPFLFDGCSKLGDIRLIGQNFEDEIQLAQNLVFTFNKDLAPTSELNSWSSTKYIDFVPAVAGKFKWTSANEVVFSPSAGFDPATNYEANLSSELAKMSKEKKYSVASKKLSFHTPSLQLIETESYWTKAKSGGQPLAKTKLRFNYAVNSDEVSSKLKINSEDKPLSYLVNSASNTEEIGVTLSNALADKEITPINILLEKGIKLPNSGKQTTEPFEYQTTLPSARSLEVNDIETGFQNNKGFVRVVTTQTLQADKIDTYYTIQPAIETTTELTENGFIIRGDFNQNETYVLTLTKEMTGVLGVKLAEPQTKDLYFGDMPANIQFMNKKAVYLSAKGSRNIGVNIVNIPKVQVRVSKVYENNILAYLRSNRYEEYAEDANGEWNPSGAFTYNEDEQNLYSDEVVNKTIETANLPKIKGASALNLALPDQNDFRGIYVVNVQSKDEQYLGATKMVSISDIGLIAKQGNDEVWVFANSIRSAKPLAGVEITLVSTNNQSVYTLKTDGKGVAKFEKIGEKAPNFKIGMITARTADDFNYLFFEDTQIETSRFEVEGKRDNSTAFDAFVYGDRDIYRPGETIHFNTVVRQQHWESPNEIPLIIKVLLPNGRELQSFRKTTNSEGAIDTEISLNAAAVTGTYTIEVYNGNNVLLTSKGISVEEFMPDRIKVDVKADHDYYNSGQNINLSATALNLFGPPASGRNYEMEFSLKPKSFIAEKFKDYAFNSSLANDTKTENVVRQGITNENGIANESFLIPSSFQDIGVLEGKVYVTVFDETGRPVNRVKRVDIFTQSTFFGLKIADSYVGLNAPVPVGLVAVDKDGKLQSNASAQVEVVRIEYQTVIEKQGDQLKYTSRKKEKVVYSNIARFKDGKTELSYVPTVSGEYEVRVRRAGSSHYSAIDFYAYGWGSTSASSFEVSNEGEVLMEFDKPKYDVGDKATVLFKTPFNGKLLVTVERNKILEYSYLDTDNKAAEFSFRIGDAHLPNVYVTATLIRPLDASNMPLMVAHGFAPVRVENADTQLPVEVVAVEKSRSKTKQTIKIKTARNAQVTVAVVDEGILQLKNFKTPDIHGYFYQKRALEVGSFDLYKFLFPELSMATKSSVGGDGYDLEKRVNPLSNGRVQLVAFWSGQINTGFDGEAEFEVNIPQFSGDLRVMAVAYKGKAFGSGQKNMKVADPIVISTALPRFMSPDDEIIVPVNVTNTEKQATNVKVSLTTTGMVTLNSKLITQNLVVAAEKEARTNFTVKAAQGMGTGTVLVTVDNGKEKFTEKIDLTVRPASSLLKTSQSGIIAGGSVGKIEAANGFIPNTVSGKIILSRSPMVQYAKTLDYLLGYPHGCIEQTVSKAFPQLYFADMAKTIRPKTYISKVEESDYNPTFNVQEAIKKIESMQMPSGAMSYWPGGISESNWGTAYAAHFLLEAQKAGFDVNQLVLGKMLDYLSTLTSTPATEKESIFNESGSYTVIEVADRTNIYSLYMLAQAGKANRATMNYYKQNQNLLTSDSRYLLASAYKQMGDGRSYTQLLPQSLGRSITKSQLSGSFASPIRNLALTLNTMIETDPENLQIPTLARQLSQALNTASYLNTQESAFAFLAMGKLAKRNTNSTVTAKITINGKTQNFDGKDITTNSPLPLTTPSLITTSGKGSLYWFAQSEGLSATGNYVEEDAGLRVRRQYLNRNGQAVAAFHQNDLIVVKVSLTSTNGTEIENVVVTDLLPAGFEIENPRLTEERSMTWIKNATTPDYFDIRDDRINYYTSANGTEKTFYYMVRAVSKGNFTLGPVSADAMYSGDYRSYWGGGRLRIE